MNIQKLFTAAPGEQNDAILRRVRRVMERVAERAMKHHHRVTRGRVHGGAKHRARKLCEKECDILDRIAAEYRRHRSSF